MVGIYLYIYEVYTILLQSNLRKKEVYHPPSTTHHPNKKNVFGVESEILIKYKRIKWTPNRKALHLLPGGKIPHKFLQELSYKLMTQKI